MSERVTFTVTVLYFSSTVTNSINIKLNNQNTYLLILGVHGDYIILVVLFLRCYIVWMWAMLSKFRRYMMPPSSGLKFVGDSSAIGWFTAREHRLQMGCLINS
jgi:hypothetical protein